MIKLKRDETPPASADTVAGVNFYHMEEVRI